MKIFKFFIATVVFLLITFIIVACGANKYAPRQENVIDRENTAPTNPNIYTGEQAKPTNEPTPVPQSTPKPAAPEEDIIGSYQTTLLDTDSDRVKNIRLAIQKINGYTVQPDEIFSFNGVVGSREPEKGYKKARIILKGKKAEGTGGGICQLSSTLYNAVEEAGLDVVERHSHSKDVHYVPEGQDATVVYGSQDFKFKNTKDYPIKIRASVKNGNVYVSILKA